MAIWCDGVRSAQSLIEHVERCMSENNIHFHEIMLYPFRSNGGRSNGVTAIFINGTQYATISVYEHWNSDDIAIKFGKHVPINHDEKHDIPSIQFNASQSKEAACAIQYFLAKYFYLSLVKDWYVPSSNYKGISSIDQDSMNYVIDKMVPIIKEFDM